MIALIAPLLAQAVVPGFAPPLDRPLSYTVSETRDDGAATRRFTVERRVTFHAAPDGFTAEVETLSASGDAGPAGRTFEAMARAMTGQRVALTLDRTGKVTNVVNLDALWAAQVDAMTAALTGGRAADTLAATLVDPLRSLSREARIERIAQLVAPLIASEPIVPHAARPIVLPARGRDGATALLAGTERIDAAPGGMLLFERAASGPVSGVPTTITQRRRIDPRLGLAEETVSVTTIAVAGTRLIVTRSTLLTR